MAKISILGAGGWGIALALKSFRKGNTTVLWSPFKEEVEMLSEKRENVKLLKGVRIPEEITVTDDLNAIDGSDITVIAVPSFAVRETAARLKTIDHGIVVNVAKGFEKASMLRLSEVIRSELADCRLVILSGPSHAEEVARDVSTTVVAASFDPKAAEFVQKNMMGDDFRIYTNPDMIGVEIGGAVKNVVAVAAGIINGLGVGDNTRAALISRGLAEMARLGTAMGADVKTFMGLSGLGDLIVTCMSVHSRNNRFGNLVGQGISVKEALRAVGTVEGYFAVETVKRLSEKYGVEMPITCECYKILFEGADPSESMKRLMTRAACSESENPWL